MKNNKWTAECPACGAEVEIKDFENICDCGFICKVSIDWYNPIETE